MSKQYATYHAEKGSVSSGGIGKHIDRAEGAEHTYRHADQERTHLNENILVNEHCKKPLHVGISDRISEGYSAKNKAGELKAIRKDAVKYTTHILTGSHEQMKKIENDPQARKAWIKANLEFIKKEYGEKNIVRFSVHRDEKTMHIHAVTVPLTSDGRLSAKEVLGGRKEMSERQDRYAAQMKPFGLERGERATGIKHENAREYYARIEQAQNSIDKNDFKAQKEYQQKINKMKKNNFHELMEIAYEKGSLIFNEKFKNFTTEYKNEHLYTFARTIEEFSRNFELGVLVKTFNSKLLKELIDLLYSGNYSNDDIIYFYGFIPNEKKSFFPVYFEEVKIYAFGVIIFNSESVNYKSIN